MSSTTLSLSVDELYAKWCGPRETRPQVSSRAPTPAASWSGSLGPFGATVSYPSLHKDDWVHENRDSDSAAGSHGSVPPPAAELHKRLSRSLVDRIAALEARTTTLPVVAARTGPVGGSPTIVNRSGSSEAPAPPRDDLLRQSAELAVEPSSSPSKERVDGAGTAGLAPLGRPLGSAGMSADRERRSSHETGSEADLVEQIMRLHRENLRLRRKLEDLTVHQDDTVAISVAQLRDKHRQCELQWHREREFLVERLMHAEADLHAAEAVAEARASAAKHLQAKVDEVEARAEIRERELLATIAVMEREKTLRELQYAAVYDKKSVECRVASKNSADDDRWLAPEGNHLPVHQVPPIDDRRLAQGAEETTTTSRRAPWGVQLPAHHPSADECRQCALTNERLERARRELEEATTDWCTVAHQVAEYATTVLEDVRGECSTLLLASPQRPTEQARP